MIEKATQNIQRGKGGIKTIALLSGLVAGQVAFGTIKGFKDLPSTVKAVVENPSVLKICISCGQVSFFSLFKRFQILSGF